MVDYRSILVERMEYKDSILYLYCRTFYKVVGDGEYNKYDYRLYHRKVLKFKNVKRFEYYSDEVYDNFLNELEDLRAELGVLYFRKIFNRSKKRNKLFISGMGYFDNFIAIEFKDDEKEKIVINEKEKYLEIKKELLEIFQSKKIKYKEINIKLEVIEKEDSYIINLEKGEKVATLSLRMPDSTRYYYIHYEEITNNFAHYDWYDEEYYTVSEIAKQLNIILDRF
ncbi:hypothetical protein O3799_05375 [Fusobacterium periodonticum]|uniref:hypothetical protein n=1 Tax=Fusobacterium periodonticum TaxID=860 RepID=UPI00352DF49E